MRRIIPPLILGAIAIAIVISGSVGSVAVDAQLGNIPPPNPGCSPDGSSHLTGQTYPTNELEPEFPIWCYSQPNDGSVTRVAGANDWRDTWDTTSVNAIQRFADHDYNYRVFNEFISAPSAFKAGTFVNTDHWMIDLVDVTTDRLSGGVMIAPDKTFQFENGKFVVEVDAAAGSDGMSGADRFYEIDLTPATAPTGTTTDALYGYGQFGHVGAIGCRLENGVICAQYNDTGRVTGGECPPQNAPCTGSASQPGRVWETQGVGTALTGANVQGGYQQWPIPGTNLRVSDVWRHCLDNEHDLHCRDRFRIEMTKTSIHVLANGYPIMLIDGLTASNSNGADARVPDSYFANGVRPYFTSWVNGGQHTPTRWHWNEVNVNPHDANGAPSAPSSAPSWCLGEPGTATKSPNVCPHVHVPGQPEIGAASTATATPTAAPATNTPTPGPTSTPTPTAVPATATPTPVASTTLTFDASPHPAIGPFSGQYPTGVINWGTNVWYYSGPYAQLPTNSVSFNGAGPTSAPFTFVSPRTLVSVDADNGSGAAATVTLACAGHTTVSVSVPANSIRTIATGWTTSCSTVTVGASNGWDTNLDNVVYR